MSFHYRNKLRIAITLSRAWMGLRMLPVLMLVTLLGSSVTAAAVADGPLLGYSVYGQGPEKVLVLHDWMGSSTNYDGMLKYFDPNLFQFVLVDLRGYGRSRHLKGSYDSREVADDAFTVARYLGWTQFHVIGHSMTGMVVQRMLLEDATHKSHLLKSAIAITPVAADGYPADKATKDFLWGVIDNREGAQQAFAVLAGKRLLASWGQDMANRHLASSDAVAVRGYYKMWLSENFSREVGLAKIATPLEVIGGRQDLPGFQEAHLRETIGTWFPSAEFQFITDAGHYPMFETPVYLASLIDSFLRRHVRSQTPPTGAAASP